MFTFIRHSFSIHILYKFFLLHLPQHQKRSHDTIITHSFIEYVRHESFKGYCSEATPRALQGNGGGTDTNQQSSERSSDADTSASEGLC